MADPGHWMREQRMWVLPLAAAKRLGLEDRLLPMPDRVDSGPEVYHRKPSEKPHGEPQEGPTGINQDESGGLS